LRRVPVDGAARLIRPADARLPGESLPPLRCVPLRLPIRGAARVRRGHSALARAGAPCQLRGLRMATCLRGALSAPGSLRRRGGGTLDRALARAGHAVRVAGRPLRGASSRAVFLCDLPAPHAGIALRRCFRVRDRGNPRLGDALSPGDGAGRACADCGGQQCGAAGQPGRRRGRLLPAQRHRAPAQRRAALGAPRDLLWIHAVPRLHDARHVPALRDELARAVSVVQRRGHLGHAGRPGAPGGARAPAGFARNARTPHWSTRTRLPSTRPFCGCCSW
jgi:hypothetical protein